MTDKDLAEFKDPEEEFEITDIQIQHNVAILLFDGVEVLDFAGPYEVFNVTAEVMTPAPFNVFTVSEEGYPIETRGKLSVTPDYSIEDTIPPDLLVVPGGAGVRKLLERHDLLAWIKDLAPNLEHLLSVCTGALLLGKIGLLDGLECTTHASAIDDLKKIAPHALVHTNRRYIDNGKIITAGGISAGIDMSLYVVHKMLGEDTLKKTLIEMEYGWRQDPDPIAEKYKAQLEQAKAATQEMQLDTD